MTVRQEFFARLIVELPAHDPADIDKAAKEVAHDSRCSTACRRRCA
ncbi:MAG TPA: hypothetical protein VK634_14385 [Reyranella sp.]|nr:hypothetical protein [Reyranella sp.]